MDAENEEQDMMALMGFGGFDSTKVRERDHIPTFRFQPPVNYML